jgi:hypothetical protein
MNMPRVKNEISIGSIVSWAAIIGTIITLGMSIGAAQTDIEGLKASQAQSSADSRALIRLQADMDYLKAAVDEIRAGN